MDIIARLRAEAPKAVACEHESYLAEAAIEIERLRDALMHMRVCASCAEGDWDDCEGGREANALLPPMPSFSSSPEPT